MANTLRYAVVQYNLNDLPQRMIADYIDDVTEEEGRSITLRDDMGNPDVNIFDNFKNMVEQHVIVDGTLIQAVVQYAVDGLPERMIVQYVDANGEKLQQIIDRVDMGNPDAQIFDNFKNMVEQHMI